MIGVYGCLTPLDHRVSDKALERKTDDGPLRDGGPLTQDALLAAEELETLHEAYKQKKAAEERG